MPATLPLEMQPTDVQHDKWCWAAVAASVAAFMDKRDCTQCSVASKVLKNPGCCSDPSVCNNEPRKLDEALTAVQHFLYSSPAPADFPSLVDQIEAKRPLGVRVGWSGGGIGHFAAIVGYDEANGYIVIEDPLYGHSEMPFEIFRAAYQGTGTWTDTFFTI